MFFLISYTTFNLYIFLFSAFYFIYDKSTDAF